MPGAAVDWASGWARGPWHPGKGPVLKDWTQKLRCLIRGLMKLEENPIIPRPFPGQKVPYSHECFLLWELPGCCPTRGEAHPEVSALNKERKVKGDTFVFPFQRATYIKITIVIIFFKFYLF